jgi:beta-glucosidase
MTAYNAYNGIPMATSPLLRSMVMDRWGFNGMIDTDRGALTFMVTKHKYYPDMAKAAAGAIHAGVNQFLNPYQDAVKAALQQKLLTEADIDRDLQGVLRVMLRLGFLDSSSPAAYTGIKAAGAPAPWDGQAARLLALQATEESIVLLKNSANLLPLNPSTVHSIAVVGPSANVVYLDGYSGTPPSAVTPFQGLEHKTNGAKVTVRYSPGGSAAVHLAKNSDVAIVVVGNRAFCRRKTDPPPCPDPTEGQEGKDRRQIHLKPDQEKLIQDVYAANRRTVVVLVSSFRPSCRWPTTAKRRGMPWPT